VDGAIQSAGKRCHFAHSPAELNCREHDWRPQLLLAQVGAQSAVLALESTSHLRCAPKYGHVFRPSHRFNTLHHSASTSVCQAKPLTTANTASARPALSFSAGSKRELIDCTISPTPYIAHRRVPFGRIVRAWLRGPGRDGSSRGRPTTGQSDLQNFATTSAARCWDPWHGFTAYTRPVQSVTC
jgi:hypothetical protein